MPISKTSPAIIEGPAEATSPLLLLTKEGDSLTFTPYFFPMPMSEDPLFFGDDNPFIGCRDILHDALTKSGMTEHAIIFTEDIGIPGGSGR